MSGYKRVNFYELCRLCATNQQKEKTHIFQEEGRKIQLQNKIQSCLSLTVCENDFLPKVVCSKCLRTLEVCYSFRQECVSSESMLSSYFKNFRYTEDFKKSGKVYIKDTSPKCSQYQQTTELPPSGTLIATQIDQKPLQPQQQQQQQQQQPLEGVPLYTLQLPLVTPQLDQKIKTETKPQIAPSGGQQQQQQQQQPLINYNLNTINLAAIKTIPKMAPNLNNDVVVNSNGEIINIAQLVDFEAIINQATATNQKINKNSGATTGTGSNKRKSRPGGASGGVGGGGGACADEPLVKIDLTNHELQQQQQQNDQGVVVDNSNKQMRAKLQYTVKVEDSKVIFNNLDLSQSQFSASACQMSMVAPSTTNVICTNNSQQSQQQQQQQQQQQTEPSTVNLNVLGPDLIVSNNNNYRTNNNSSSSSFIKMAGSATAAASTTTTTTTTIITNATNQTEPDPINTSALAQQAPPTVKSHICEICQKSFKRREHLYQHVKLHTGFRPYTCENCNKSFMRKEHLLRHMTSHSGQKNFTCTICDKSFSRNDNLLKHKKTHEKQSSYTCDVCQKQFVMKHYYLAHKLTHDGDRCNTSIANVWLKT